MIKLSSYIPHKIYTSKDELLGTSFILNQKLLLDMNLLSPSVVTKLFRLYRRFLHQVKGGK